MKRKRDKKLVTFIVLLYVLKRNKNEILSFRYLF